MMILDNSVWVCVFFFLCLSTPSDVSSCWPEEITVKKKVT